MTCQGDEKAVLYVNERGYFVFLIRQNDLGALGSQDVTEIVRVSDAPCDSQNEVLLQFKLTKHLKFGFDEFDGERKWS